jgi:acyl-CoA thioesterase FadM
MNLYLRLLRVIARALTSPKLAVFDTSVIQLRTWPVDVDVRRANNGRYITLMDLGRMDYLCRTGILQEVVRRRWTPLVAGLTIRYRRSLVLLRPFELHSRLLWWDERFVYFEQRFVQDGETAAIALLRTALKDGRDTVPTEAMARAFGFPTHPPPCPDVILRWSHADEALAAA